MLVPPLGGLLEPVRARRRATRGRRRAFEAVLQCWTVSLCLALLSGNVAAQLSGTVSLLSNYRFRGISLSADEPAAQLGLAYDDAQGWYAGGFASTVEFPLSSERRLRRYLLSATHGAAPMDRAGRSGPTTPPSPPRATTTWKRIWVSHSRMSARGCITRTVTSGRTPARSTPKSTPVHRSLSGCGCLPTSASCTTTVSTRTPASASISSMAAWRWESTWRPTALS